MSQKYWVFDLPEERYEYALAYHGSDFYSCLSDLDEWLRNEIKHGDKHELQPARDKLHEIMESRSVSLDMVS